MTTTVLTLTWTPADLGPFGPGFQLTGGAVECGSAFWRASKRQGFAHAFIGGRYLSATGASVNLAVKRLQREIERRSIGLLGVDDIEFRRAS